MKKLASILIGFFYSVIIIWAQTPVITVPLDNNLQVTTDMIQTNDGLFIITGINWSHDIVCVTCLSDEGMILWSSILHGTMEWYTNITEKSNGNLLIPMCNPFHAKLVELNSFGDSVNSSNIAEINQSLFSSVIEINDSLIIAAEIIRNSDPFFPGYDSSLLVKMDEELNIIEKIPTPFRTIKSLTKTSDTCFFALVTQNSNNLSYIKYSISGNVLTNTTCSNSVNSIIQHRILRLNSNYLAAIGFKFDNPEMSAHLSKIDQTGEVIYCNSYNNPYFMSITNNDATENLFLIGNESEVCTIYRMDYAGNPFSSFSLNDSLIGTSIIFDDANLYLSGYYDGSEVNIVGSRFIIFNADSIFSIPENSDNLKITIVPNPAKEKISIDGVKAGKATIFNSTGMLVKESEMSGKITQIDISKLPDGLYILQVITKDGIVAKKFIKY